MTNSAAKEPETIFYLPGAAFTSAERPLRLEGPAVKATADLNGGNLAKFKFIAARGRSHLARSIALH
jgi:hypothetical protein